MKRDAQATKQRIFEAATAEFSQYGIAGARIDRIAAASGSNKSMIYTYYGSKDELFDAVGVLWINRHMHDVPIDVLDLPEYAARLFDHYREHPEMMRLVTWARLERKPEAIAVKPVLESYKGKVEAIEQAQQEGSISNYFPPAVLLELIMALTQTRADFTIDTCDLDEPARRRRAIKDAVTILVGGSSSVD
jgi:AcrR family transcriptional regulator